MGLTLTPAHIQSIQSDAVQAYPNEGCGLLLGSFDRATGTHVLEQVKLLDNAWQPNLASTLDTTASAGQEPLTQARRYWIDPKDMLAIQREARDQGLSIIGVYHSHPDHPAIPSECDRTLAWPDYAYIIVSVQDGNAVDLQCWQLDPQHQFQSEPMMVADLTTPAPVEIGCEARSALLLGDCDTQSNQPRDERDNFTDRISPPSA